MRSEHLYSIKVVFQYLKSQAGVLQVLVSQDLPGSPQATLRYNTVASPCRTLPDRARRGPGAVRQRSYCAGVVLQFLCWINEWASTQAHTSTHAHIERAYQRLWEQKLCDHHPGPALVNKESITDSS